MDRLRGGAWIIRESESDVGFAWPIYSKMKNSSYICFELFGKRIVISFWRENQLTNEEWEREL